MKKSKPLSARARAARLNVLADGPGIWIRGRMAWRFKSSFGEVLVSRMGDTAGFVPFPGAERYEDVLVDINDQPLPPELFVPNEKI